MFWSKGVRLLPSKRFWLQNIHISALNGMTYRTMNTSPDIKLSVSPPSSLVDSDLSICVSGFNKFDRVSLFNYTEVDSKKYGAVGHYIADINGCVDPKKQPSVGGSYTGIEGLGLIWGLDPMPGQDPSIRRLLKRDITTPLDYSVSVSHGHVDLSKIQTSEKITSANFERWYLSKNVKRTVISEGRLRATLFTPTDRPPCAPVIDIFGAAGGIIEHRAAILASKGFATLAVAYFNYADLPKKLKLLDLDYFEEAKDFLKKSPLVDASNGIGAIGTSSAVGIVTNMARYFPEIRAVVTINGWSTILATPMKYKDITRQPIEVAGYSDGEPFEAGNITFNDDGSVFGRNYLPEKAVLDDKVCVHIEKSANANFLFIASEHDEGIHPHLAPAMGERLKRHGKSNFEVLTLPGAGHLLEPPHSPLGCRGYNRLIQVEMMYGGEKRCHAYAQVLAWNKMQEFFKKYLSGNTDIPSSNL